MINNAYSKAEIVWCYLSNQVGEKDKRRPLHQDGNLFEPLDEQKPACMHK
jgi:hypothetical protein